MEQSCIARKRLIGEVGHVLGDANPRGLFLNSADHCFLLAHLQGLGQRFEQFILFIGEAESHSHTVNGITVIPPTHLRIFGPSGLAGTGTHPAGRT
ncbi:MAG: hypothetical protein JWN95_3384 [Frankiales bacterium]|nr:hypothetical protein [Frankiales bacterium]